MTSRNAVRCSVPSSELPDFTPVPRQVQRHDGWTPARQKAFIEALADTGCVAIACRMVNMSQRSAYQLRRQPGAESFRAAWDAAQTLGLQPVKDEAFHRAMHGEMIPVFVGGKLMGFRRKKNDRLLIFILRHYGQDAQGRKTTINYFSTRATAGAAAPSGRQPTRSDALTSARDAGSGRPTTGEAVSIDVTDSLRDDAFSLAEASTTTVKTVISGPGGAGDPLAADDEAANVLNNFEGVELDAEAQDQIHRALAACAERRRALEDDPENDSERFFIGEEETNGYLGELESGAEDDWVEYKPEGEHRWESLGAGGQAAEIDRVVAEIEERRAARTPEQIAAEEAEDKAERQRMRGQRLKALNAPVPEEPDPDDPRSDWSNWTSGGYVPPSPEIADPEPVEGPISPRLRKSEEPAPAKAGGKPLKRYRKRRPKPPFTPPTACPGPRSGEARKAEAVAAVKAERRAGAAAEAERRKRRRGGQ